VSQDLDLPVVETFHTIARTAQRHGEAIGVERTRLETAVGRTAAAVIAVSESEQAELVRIGVPRHRLAVVPGGVDIKQFTPRGPAMPHGKAYRLLAMGRPWASRALTGHGRGTGIASPTRRRTSTGRSAANRKTAGLAG
jgi:glycosyltransferase involved in cell wall biosynthesis